MPVRETSQGEDLLVEKTPLQPIFFAAQALRLLAAEAWINVTRMMNEAETRELLNCSRVGRLGCIFQGEPYVLPLNYLFEDGCIYSHSLPGKKIDALRANPRACLQVDDISDDLHWRSVIAFGRFEEIQQIQERAELLRKLLQRFPLLTPVESRLVDDAAPPDFVIFRIRVDRITGMAED